MKKITVKTEKEVLRKAIPYGDEVIVINELSERQKLEIINEMQKKLALDEKIDERKFMLDIIDKCTNVEFDKNIFEVEEPTYEATIIIGEVTLMFLELVDEQKIYTNIQLKVNGNTKKEVKEEEEKIKEIKEEVEIKEVKEEVKEEVKKIVKPKKRPRGKR
jgi:hypothetical protein